MILYEDEKALFLLLSIVDLNGSATKREVLDNIRRQDYIGAIDYEEDRLKNFSNRPLWENKLSWKRSDMVNKGYIKDFIPGVNKGQWEITEAGREHLYELCKKIVGIISSAEENEADHEYHTTSSSYNRAVEFMAQVEKENNIIQQEAPMAEDLTEPSEPRRILYRTYRVIRDTELTRKIKILHEFRCQICGESICFASGRKYAEGHHIRPLSPKHGGPDVAENIICVCPNHHVQLDYGVIKLDGSSIRRAIGHTIGDKYIEYHNNQIFGLH